MTSVQERYAARYAESLMNTFGPPKLTLARGEGAHVFPGLDSVDKGAADHHAVCDLGNLPGGLSVIDAEAHRDRHAGVLPGQGEHSGYLAQRRTCTGTRHARD